MQQLNDELEEARIAAGLIPLTGTGIVLQLEDSQEPVAPEGDSAADYLVGARDIRTVVEELWLAGAEAIAVNGERITPTTRDHRHRLDRCWSTRPTSRRRTRSRPSARTTCTTG